MRIGQLGYLVALALAEIVGDFAYERYANTGLVSAFGLGTLGYVGVVYFLIKSLAGSTILYVDGVGGAGIEHVVGIPCGDGVPRGRV